MSILETEFESKWACLGIAFSGGRSDHYVDPENTIIESLILLYQDRKYLRLFLDWMVEYHNLIHVERLLAIIKKSNTRSRLEIQMLGGISSYIKAETKDLRWKIIEKYCSEIEMTSYQSDDDNYLLAKHGANNHFAKYVRRAKGANPCG